VLLTQSNLPHSNNSKILSDFVLQAQTVANFFLAFDQNLAIVPVLNKIDMTSADPDKVAEEMQQVPPGLLHLLLQ